MQINPSEVKKILKEQIKKFGEKAEVSYFFLIFLI